MKKIRKKVLIAEDEKPMARAMELKLQHEGFGTHVVFDGEGALEALMHGGYDVAILDLMMPKKDGFEVLQTLKQMQIKTPIIVASNLSQQEDIRRAKDLGAKDYFIKSDTPIATIIQYVKHALTAA